VGIRSPLRFSTDDIRFNRRTVSTFPFDIAPMYTQSWTLALQRQVGTDWLVSASYIGNKIEPQVAECPG